ncbi:MAG: MerR family transcriptional regulator [Blastocatellia bacterium]|nr:MerR family transcriptional regulator [Blastocatellia bacterium]
MINSFTDQGTLHSARFVLPARTYTVTELMKITGMTRQQVSYWAKLQIVVPSISEQAEVKGPGHKSLYGVTDVIEGLIVSELRRAGFSLQSIRKVVERLKAEDIELYESAPFLLTDGRSVYYAYSDKEVVDLLRAHRQQLLLLSLEEQLVKVPDIRKAA